LKARADSGFYRLEPGDVLISSIGFGSIGKVQVFDKVGTYGTASEVSVVRQRQMNPYYLAAFLRSRFGQLQINRCITGATGQLHLYKRDVETFFVPNLPKDIQVEFERLALKARATKRRARKLIENGKNAVDLAITQSEIAALNLLEEKK
jgi:type I restriction enzyme, S subunit